MAGFMATIELAHMKIFTQIEIKNDETLRSTQIPHQPLSVHLQRELQ